jgi:hypothetical protein
VSGRIHEPPAGLQAILADLHVHTALSPCAAAEMIPPLIVDEALACGLGLIAIADHNASANVAAVQRAAAGTPLTVLPGMELQTIEDVHLLCLFDTLAQLSHWQSIVDAHLPAIENTVEVFGEQLVVDERGEFLRRESRLLSTAASIPLKRAISEVGGLGGLAIPAHVDRPHNSLLANLGFVPRDAGIEALEISHNITPQIARGRFPELATGRYPLIQSGDVHHLDGFCTSTVFVLGAPTIQEIRLALAGRAGRSVRICSRAA